jgi:hypothetical protein
LLSLLASLGSGGTPRARFSCSHSLIMCMASRWNWD